MKLFAVTMTMNGVKHVCPFNDQNDRSREIDFLDNLKGDLHVLENTWKKKKLHRKKTLNQFIEIVDSILDIARPEPVEQFETVCAEFRNFLLSVANDGVQLPETSWGMASELADLLRSYFSDGDIPASRLDEWYSCWQTSAVLHEPNQPEPQLPTGNAGAALPPEERDNMQSPAQEEDEMADTVQMDAKQLLQKAQEALLSGDGDGAKDLALKAAEMIAKTEAEEARKKEKLTRSELELAVHEEMEAEEIFERLKEEMADRNGELASLNNRIAETQTSFEEQQRACLKIKEEIEKTEAELARLQEEHRNLREQFQEALPARDAAERECTRVTGQLEQLNPEIDILTDSLAAAESQLEKARQKRAEKEAELGKLVDKIGV